MNLIIVIKRKEHALRHPYQTCARAKAMGEVEEVQEQMKDDMEAMMSMKKIMKADVGSSGLGIIKKGGLN